MQAARRQGGGRQAGKQTEGIRQRVRDRETFFRSYGPGGFTRSLYLKEEDLFFAQQDELAQQQTATDRDCILVTSVCMPLASCAQAISGSSGPRSRRHEDPSTALRPLSALCPLFAAQVSTHSHLTHLRSPVLSTAASLKMRGRGHSCCCVLRLSQPTDCCAPPPTDFLARRGVEGWELPS